MSTPPIDVEKAHRWFAIECNNGSWDLVEAEERTPEQVEEMLNVAHAAKFHWQHAGNELNLLRADVLLATAYCVAKRSEGALRYAEHAQAHLKTVEGETHFDRATIAGARAFAFLLAEQKQESVDATNEFKQRLEEIDEESEKELLLKLYPVL